MPTVAQVIIRTLKDARTPRLFTAAGDGFNLLDTARALGFPVAGCHHATAAVVMAWVTGELTGQPGIAVAPLGPRAVNGIASAHWNRAPVVFLTESRSIIDHHALKAFVKASVTVTAESAGNQIFHVLQLALTEPRGPVHLDLPAEVAGAEAVPVAASVLREPLLPPDPDALDRAAALIKAAHRPLVIAGLECRGPGDAKWLRAMAEALPVPVLTTLKAKGVLPDAHPLHLGTFPGGGVEEAVIRKADLIVTFGLDSVELFPPLWSYLQPVVHLSRSSHSDRSYTPAVEVNGDLSLILEELAPRLRGQTQVDWDVAQLDRFKRERLPKPLMPTRRLSPERAIKVCQQLTPPGSLVTVDPLLPAANFWEAEEPGTCLISNGPDARGFALPAAIAAQLVHPERRVLCLTEGDGLMTVVAELETVVRLGLPIVIVVFNDQNSPPVPDLCGLARSFGLAAFRAETERELRDAVEAAMASGGPALIEARVDLSTQSCSL